MRCSEKSRGNKEFLVPKETARPEAKSKKLTTPYPHKYKTVLCKFWAKGQKCPFGNDCNYAHGHNQLVDKVSDRNKESAGDSSSALSDKENYGLNEASKSETWGTVQIDSVDSDSQEEAKKVRAANRADENLTKKNLKGPGYD